MTRIVGHKYVGMAKHERRGAIQKDVTAWLSEKPLTGAEMSRLGGFANRHTFKAFMNAGNCSEIARGFRALVMEGKIFLNGKKWTLVKDAVQTNIDDVEESFSISLKKFGNALVKHMNSKTYPESVKFDYTLISQSEEDRVISIAIKAEKYQGDTLII